MNFAGLLLSLLLSSSLIPHSPAQPNPDDIAAMQALSRSLSGDKSLGWSPSTSPCNWRFVTCSGDRVSSIQIGNQSLSGRIPPDIAKLTSLTRLELHSNQISGDLNPISSLTSLQTLLLHNNLFSYIPASFFANLTSLRAVYLDDNPFQIWEIPESLRSAVNLVNFSANSANVSGEIPDFVATGFPSLNHLALAFNLLSGNIPPSFAGSPIRSLWLNNQRGGAAFSGGIGFIQNMTDLEQLWLNSNSFSGPLPDFSALINLRDLRLRDNYFTGPIPSSLTSLKSLTKLSLTNNLLQGSFPKFPNSINELDLDPMTERFCLLNQGVPCDPQVDTLISISSSFHYPVQFAENWKGNNPCDGSWIGISCDNKGNIIVINFQKMGLNGTISPEFAKLVDLQLLLLSNNNLTGEIPSSLTRLTSLKELDVSYNSLVGKLPIFANNVVLKTQGNPNIGQDLPPSSSTSGDDPGIAGKPKVSSNSSLGVILGSVLAAVCAVSLLVFAGTCYYKRKKQQFHRVQSPTDSSPDNIKITVAAPNANCNNEIQVAEAGNMVISIQVLRNVTNNFSEENIIGRGGFGTVYRGDLHDGTKIAVKRMDCGGAVGSKGLNEFESEIAVLTKVRHRNLVSLLGYCLDGGERLLVYEYMPQGSLSRHLFEWKEEGLRPLEWKKRLSIALDVARGVEYLHTLAHQSFIHRDLKPSNILLGDDMKAKVADFGLVRLADGKGCAAVTKLAGTFGYLAPEYAAIGRVTTKADVFSFGVILMEMITGRKALDETQPEESVHLVTWFRRMQIANRDGGFLKSVVDPSAVDVGDEEALAGIAAVVGLAGHCCNREPGQRPDMGHAVNVLSTLTELWKPSDPDTEESCGIDLDMSLPQALKRWQAFEDRGGGEMSSFLAGIDSTSTIIPTRPPGFAETFTSGDGR